MNGIKLISAGLIISGWIATGCSTLSQMGTVYRESTLNDLNPAPSSMTPPSEEVKSGPTIDPMHMRSQADYHFTLGEAYALEGNSRKAIEEFKLTLVYDPDSTLVRLRLAAEFVRQGLLSEAIEQAEVAVQTDPKHVDARLLLAGLYSSMKMFGQALEQYDQLLEFHPDNLDAPIYIGAIYAEQRKYDEAIAYFRKLAENSKYSKRYQAYFYIGRIRLEQGEDSHLRMAEEAFSKAIAMKPDYIDGVMSLAELYEHQDRHKKVRALLESFQAKFGPERGVALKLSEIYLAGEEFDKAYDQLDIVDGFDRTNLNVKVKMAIILIEQKKLEKATGLLEDVLAQAPESDKIRFYLAAVFEERGLSDEAITNYLKISSHSPYYGEAIVHSAYLHKKEGRLEKSQEVIENALNERGDIPQFYSFYASLLDDQKKYKQALELLIEAVDKFPEHTQLRFFLGSLHDRVGDKEKTVQEMNRVLEIDANHVQALNYLAYTYAEMNQDLDRAEELARKALSIQPNDGYILDTVGWVLFKKGQVEESIRFLEAAHKKKSNESIIAEHLGDAYYRFQLMRKAKNMYLKAVEAETDAKKLKEIRAKIVAIEKQQENHQAQRTPATARSEKKPADNKEAE